VGGRGDDGAIFVSYLREVLLNRGVTIFEDDGHCSYVRPRRTLFRQILRATPVLLRARPRSDRCTRVRRRARRYGRV